MPELFDYQIEDRARIWERQKQIVNYNMGLGKSGLLIETVREYGLSRILIATTNKLKYNFAMEIEKWYPQAPVLVVDGPEQEKLDQIEWFSKGFLIVSYDTCQRVSPERRKKLEEKGRRVPFDFTNVLGKMPWHLIGLDEAHRLCNRKAYHTEGCDYIAHTSKAPLVLPMTGTLMQNEGMDIWPLLRLMDRKRYSSYWNFAKKHFKAQPGIYGWEVEPEPTDPVAFQEEIAPYVIRRDDEDSAVMRSVPRLQEEPVYVQLGEEQRRLYDRMEKLSMMELGEDGALLATNVLAQLTRLRQISIAPELVGSKCKESPKLDAALEIIENTPPHVKVLVMSQWAEVLNLFQARLESAKIISLLVRGGTSLSQEEFQHRLHQFKTDPKIKVLLGTTESIGEGQNLTEATMLIMLDQHWNPMKNDQPIKRIHRVGQTNRTVVYHIRALNTVEQWVDEKVDRKSNILRQIYSLFKQRRKDIAQN